MAPNVGKTTFAIGLVNLSLRDEGGWKILNLHLDGRDFWFELSLNTWIKWSKNCWSALRCPWDRTLYENITLVARLGYGNLLQWQQFPRWLLTDILRMPVEVPHEERSGSGFLVWMMIPRVRIELQWSKIKVSCNWSIQTKITSKWIKYLEIRGKCWVGQTGSESFHTEDHLGWVQGSCRKNKFASGIQLKIDHSFT